MSFSATVRGERFVFADLRDLLARASEAKSGDQLAGVAARSERERAAAKLALADVPLRTILDNPVLDPDADDVSRLLCDSLARETFTPLRSLTVGEYRERLLAADGWTIRSWRWGVTPEVVAAVARLMSNLDLVHVAAEVRNVTRCKNTLGQPGVFAVRVQPNHPTDDLAGILLAAVDGLLHGGGDAVLGVNPTTLLARSAPAQCR